MKNVRDIQGRTRRSAARRELTPVDASEGGPVLITGGAGFIGTNLADRILHAGRPVYIYDNLSRPGVERNLKWLREKHGKLLHTLVSDTRNSYALVKVIREVKQVFHFAAQVAVTTSLINPMHDFYVNTCGTMNLLEAIRSVCHPPSLVYTSTNKVYGALSDLKLVRNGRHYQPANSTIRAHGISEERPLDFHSPYGCSKGAADQYVIDYARTFSIPSAVFRMSCIYGPHQCGNEDQGWVAHFLICALENRPITIYGDGGQVRDILFIEDLIDAFLLAQKNMAGISGQAFNIGGGPGSTISLHDLLDLIGNIHGRKPAVRFDAWRIGDQRYYVSNTEKFHQATGWVPRVGVREGVERLYNWLRDQRRLPLTDAASYRGSQDYEILAR